MVEFLTNSLDWKFNLENNFTEKHELSKKLVWIMNKVEIFLTSINQQKMEDNFIPKIDK